MNRKQLYNEITSRGLFGVVKGKYGKNYTTCTNAQLQAVVDEAHTGMKKLNKSTKNSKFDKLVEILAKKNILLKSEVDTIMKS